LITFYKFFDGMSNPEYLNFFKLVCRLCCYLPNDLSWDIFGECIAYMLEKHPNMVFNKREGIIKYITKMMGNKSIDYFRKYRNPSYEYYEGEVNEYLFGIFEDPRFSEFDFEQIVDLANLNDRERDVLMMLYEGYKIREIANFFGVSERTVRRWKNSLISKIKKAFKR